MTLRALTLALCALALPVFAQPPTVQTTPITGDLYLLQGRGGNVVALIGDDGVLLVDDDYGNYQPAYLEAIKALGEDQVRYVVNTHWHGDHSGSNAAWTESGSVILAHENVFARMSTRQENTFFGRVTEASPAAAWPQVTFADSIAVRINGHTLEVRHYPSGHTDGDSVVFFTEADVVHMGDHYFKDRFPFVDIASGGTVGGYTDNILALLQRIGPDTIIVPGHGAIATRDDLQRYYEMLVETRAEVRAMQDEGLDLEAIQARGLDEKWASWGEGFIKPDSWIAFIIASPR